MLKSKVKYYLLTLLIFLFYLACKQPIQRSWFNENYNGLPLSWGVSVFETSFLEARGDTEIFKFDYNNWEQEVVSEMVPVDMSVNLQAGKIYAIGNECFLVMDSVFIDKLQIRLNLMDFSMLTGQKKTFADPDIFRKSPTSIELDTIIFVDSIPYHKFRVTNYAQSDYWVYYVNKQKGFLGTYVSCPTDTSEIIISYQGLLPDINPTQILDPKANRHGYQCD